MTTPPFTLEPSGDLPPRGEPLGPVLGLGAREDGLVFAIALGAALLVHGVAGARALRVFPYLSDLAAFVRHGMQERMRSQVDIDLNEPPPPPPPPEPVPEPEPEPPPAQRTAAQAEPEKPPAPAEAGKILTAEEDPDAPVDLTDQGFVTGTGDHYAGGVTSSTGTAKTAVRSTAAAATGVGTGAPPAVAAPTVDRSRPAAPSSREWNDCPFPPEADLEGINAMKVQVVVTVAPDGRPRSVTVLKDPGFGFGALARRCALQNKYSPALNAAGVAVEKTTGPITVRFTR